MGFLRTIFRRLFRASDGPSPPILDPAEAKQQGYAETPASHQWTRREPEPVDRSEWQPCEACGRSIPVREDLFSSPPEFRVLSHGTCTYVCPHCRHVHVGTPADTEDSRAQTTCHECGAGLGGAYQCPECSFPRGWMTVDCPHCRGRQPVCAPHWVVHCDTFDLECVHCERGFISGCIC